MITLRETNTTRGKKNGSNLGKRSINMHRWRAHSLWAYTFTRGHASLEGAWPCRQYCRFMFSECTSRMHACMHFIKDDCGWWCLKRRYLREAWRHLSTKLMTHVRRFRHVVFLHRRKFYAMPRALRWKSVHLPCAFALWIIIAQLDVPWNNLMCRWFWSHCTVLNSGPVSIPIQILVTLQHEQSSQLA